MQITTLNLSIILFLVNLFVQTSVFSQLYIAPNGNDYNLGTKEKPLATLQKALVKVKTLRKNGNQSSIQIFLRKGEYRIKKSILIKNDILNIEIKPFNNEKVVFSGGQHLPIKNIKTTVLNGKNVYQVNLHKLGIYNFGKIRNVGFARPYGASWGEIFVNENPLHLARYPNHTMMPIGKVIDPGSILRNKDYSKRGAVFHYDSNRISKWKNTGNIWISGYFKWGYADDAVKAAEIDSITKTITTAQPTLYGFASGQAFRRWYAFNVFEELNETGEFYINSIDGMLYFIYDEEKIKTLEFSILENPFIVLENTSNVKIEGIHFTCSRGIGIAMSNTTNVTITNCSFTNLGSLAITIGKGIKPFNDYKHEGTGEPQNGIVGSLQQHIYENTTFNREGGNNNKIINCVFYNLGAGGVSIGGGNRITLESSNNSVENSVFHDINRIEKSYRPAVQLTGVGNKVSHCEMYNIPSMAIYFYGNNHVITYNNIHDVCLDVDDQGAIYYGRDPSERGTKISYNYFHNIPNRYSTSAIYHDDGACGLIVTDNIFYKAGKYAVLIGGGSDNTYRDNIFIDMPIGIHIDNRLANWAGNLIKQGQLFEKRNH